MNAASVLLMNEKVSLETIADLFRIRSFEHLQNVVAAGKPCLIMAREKIPAGENASYLGISFTPAAKGFAIDGVAFKKTEGGYIPLDPLMFLDACCHGA